MTTDPQITLPIDSVRVVGLEPGDTIVVTVPGAPFGPDDDDILRIKTSFHEAFPGHPVVIVGKDVGIHIIRAEEQDR